MSLTLPPMTRPGERWWISPGMGTLLALACLALRIAFIGLIAIPLAVGLYWLNRYIIGGATTLIGGGPLGWIFNFDMIVRAPFMVVGCILLSILAVVLLIAWYLSVDFRLQRLIKLGLGHDPRPVEALAATPFALYLRDFRRDNEILKTGDHAHVVPDVVTGTGEALGSIVTTPLIRLIHTLRTTRNWSVEELVLHELRGRTALLAIGRPGESIPANGAARFYVADSHWQDAVATLASTARLIVLRLGTTDGLRWEIEHILAMPNRPPTLIITIDDVGSGFPARRVGELLEGMPSHEFRVELETYLYVRLVSLKTDGAFKIAGANLSQHLDGQPFFGWSALIAADLADALAESQVSPQSDNPVTGRPWQAAMAALLSNGWIAIVLGTALGVLMVPWILESLSSLPAAAHSLMRH